MPKIESEVVARRVLPIIYVLDTSGSMSGDRIGALNAAMSETVEVLKDVSKRNSDAEIKVGVLKFSTDAEWVTKNGLVFLEDFFWNDLTAGGTTEVARALAALDEKLSKNQFLKSNTGSYAPVLIFMTDGAPTDPGEWEKKLAEITKVNRWFEVATKIAIAVGSDDDSQDERTKRRACLEKLVGNNEAVAEVDDLETLKKLIKFVSVSASIAYGTSRRVDDALNGGDLMKDATKKVDNPDNVKIGGDDPFVPTGSSDKKSTQSGSDWDETGW